MQYASNTFTFNSTVTLVALSCSQCGIVYALTDAYIADRQRDRAEFRCPNGHGQWFPGKTQEERRKEAERKTASALEDVRALEATLKHERTQAQAAGEKARQRTRGGACPYCDRTFVQVARHVKSQHPEHAHP